MSSIIIDFYALVCIERKTLTNQPAHTLSCALTLSLSVFQFIPFQNQTKTDKRLNAITKTFSFRISVELTWRNAKMTEDKPEENKLRYRRLEKMVSEDHSNGNGNGNGNGKDHKKYRRTQSETRAEDIKTKEEKQRRSQPDKP